jgi:hypothetical protein
LRPDLSTQEGEDKLLAAIASLPDSDFVHDACAAQVSRRSGVTWQKIWRPDRTFAFDDIDARAALNIFFNVISKEIDKHFDPPPLNWSIPRYVF